MKSKIITNTCLNVCLLLLLFSCGEKPSDNSTSEKVPTSTSTKPTATGSFLYISDESNSQLTEIGLETNGNSKITTRNGVLFGEKKGDKLKYYDQQNSFKMEIKYKDSSFKLRNSSSELLWKVKTYDNKIKLSNNEEMTAPIEIKLKNDQKIVVYKDGTEATTIRIDPSKNPLNIANKYFTSGFRNNYHAGILVLDELNPDEKYCIIAELNR